MNKGSKNLYIIGNGFDIYHGIKSGYSEFKKFLYKEDRELHNLVEQYILIGDNWSDFEQALADVDVDSITSEFLVSYSAEDWSDAYHHDYQLEIKKILTSLSVDLKDWFTCWISELEIPDSKVSTNKLLNLDASGRYLTFNYTPTLRIFYNIPEENTLFIHGEVKNESSELILGHAWKPVDTSLSNIEIDHDNIEDIRVLEGKEIINEYLGATFKPTRNIIKNNSSFFCRLKDVSRILILGHSLSQVDMEYFQAIIKVINMQSVEWSISYYDISERERHQQILNKLGVDNCRVKFNKLQDFKRFYAL